MNQNKILLLIASSAISGYVIYNYFKYQKAYKNYADNICQGEVPDYANAGGWYSQQISKNIAQNMKDSGWIDAINSTPLAKDLARGFDPFCKFNFLNETFGYQDSLKKSFVEKLINI